MTEQQRQQTYAQMLVRLSRSNFRSRFHLKAQDKQYIRDKGWNTVADHADFVSKRLAPAAARKTTASRHPCGGIRCSSRSTRPPVAAGAVWQNVAFRRVCRFRQAAGLYRWNADELMRREMKIEN